jgi:hypothetical protein
VGLLALGWGLSLGILFAGPLWNWELNEQELVGPLIPLLRTNPAGGGPTAGLPVYLWGESPSRPSLIWYSDDQLRDLPDQRTTPLPQRLLVISRSPSSSSGTPRWEQQSAASKHPDLKCRIDQKGTGRWNRWLCEREPIRP